MRGMTETCGPSVPMMCHFFRVGGCTTDAQVPRAASMTRAWRIARARSGWRRARPGRASLPERVAAATRIACDRVAPPPLSASDEVGALRSAGHWHSVAPSQPGCSLTPSHGGRSSTMSTCRSATSASTGSRSFGCATRRPPACGRSTGATATSSSTSTSSRSRRRTQSLLDHNENNGDPIFWG